MKKIYPTFICLFLICHSLYSQQTFYATLTNTRATYVPVQRAANNDILSLSSTNQRHVVVRFTASGVIKWSKSYGNGEKVLVENITPTSDNGFAMTGIDQASTFIFLIKCDSIGKIKWQSKISRPDGSIMPVTITGSTADGSIYIAAGNTNQYNQIIKFSSKGQLLWHKEYAIESGMSERALTILANADGGISIGTQAAHCPGYCSTPVLQQWNKDGKLILSKEFLISRFANDEVIPLFLFQDDQTVRMAVQERTYNAFNNRYGVINYSPATQKSSSMFLSYNLLALHRFLVTQHFSASVANANGNFLMDADGSLYLTASSAVSSTLTKRDSLNRVCPDYTIPAVDSATEKATVTTQNYPYMPVSNSIVVTTYNASSAIYTNTSVICSGDAFSFSNNTMLQNSGQKSALAISLPAVRIYPNPSSNVVWVTGLPVSSRITLSLISAQGTVLKQVVTNSGTCSLQLNALAAGTYFIRVADGKSIKTISFLKQ